MCPYRELLAVIYEDIEGGFLHINRSMRDGRQLIPDTFNEELQRVCNTLGIKYRSSHQIRFAAATLLYDEGVSITKISSLLGHADTATTWHYIRKNSPDAATINAMKSLLD